MKIESTQGTQSLLQQIQEEQTERLRKLASGKRVENAADDAAASQIIERLTAESNAYQRSMGNAYDGISMAQVAEGGLSNVNDDVSRIRELTLQAGNGALSDSDRQALQGEIDQLRGNIDQTLERTEFAGKPLLTSDSSEEFLVGSSAGQSISVDLVDVREQLSGLDNVDLTDPESRDNLLSELDTLQENISSQRADFGAIQNQFESAARNLNNTDINMQEARSRMQDLDYAMGTAENIQGQIQQSAAISVQGQANARNEQVLSVLGG